jgi:hypothetical protein
MKGIKYQEKKYIKILFTKKRTNIERNIFMLLLKIIIFTLSQVSA